MATASDCPECGQRNLYASGEIPAGKSGGSIGPFKQINFLPGLENAFSYGQLTVVLCGDCGLMRFYASKEALSQLSQSNKWHKL